MLLNGSDRLTSEDRNSLFSSSSVIHFCTALQYSLSLPSSSHSSLPSSSHQSLRPLAHINTPHHSSQDTMARTSDILLVLVAILFPPAAAGILTGCSCDLLINIALTIFGYLPGHLHAFYLSEAMSIMLLKRDFELIFPLSNSLQERTS